MRNVTVTDWYYGISYQNTQYGTIEGVNASSNAYGIGLSSTNDMTLTDSRVTGNSQSGIYLNSANDNTIYNNYFNNVNNIANGGNIRGYLEHHADCRARTLWAGHGSAGTTGRNRTVWASRRVTGIPITTVSVTMRMTYPAEPTSCRYMFRHP